MNLTSIGLRAVNSDQTFLVLSGEPSLTGGLVKRFSKKRVETIPLDRDAVVDFPGTIIVLDRADIDSDTRTLLRGLPGTIHLECDQKTGREIGRSVLCLMGLRRSGSCLAVVYPSASEDVDVQEA